jgi:hypothetical protein
LQQTETLTTNTSAVLQATLTLAVGADARIGEFQDVRPFQDISSGTWNPSTGSCEVKLQPLSNPEAGDVKIIVRHKKV